MDYVWKSPALLTMEPKKLLIKDFTYVLPDDRIAKYPLPNRDESKLLIYKAGKIEENRYQFLPDYLPSESFLVFNNTRVIEVRLLFRKQSGSVIELFCLEPADTFQDISTAMLQRGTATWKCLVGGAKKWKEEVLHKVMKIEGKDLMLSATKTEKQNDVYLVTFSWNNETLSFAEILHLFGNMPLPPYLHRAAEESDKDRYQTIYAQRDGSVAAPTAGLHFTQAVFNGLAEKQIDNGFVTLHVGAGTFKPVTSEWVSDHHMHAEFIEVSVVFIEQLLNKLPQNIIAVGTTSLRTLESLYWLGAKMMVDEATAAGNLYLSQWEAYHLPQEIPASDALVFLLNWMKKHSMETVIAKTQIMIAPGYTLRVANALVTNFHQPQSTLLLLIAAIVGDDWKRIYEYALHNDFRFLSYGDGSLLWQKN